MTDAPAPGWYDDPAGSAALRYWDGAAWTQRLRDRPPVSDPAVVGDRVPDDDEPTGPLPRVVLDEPRPESESESEREPEPEPEPEPDPDPERVDGLDALLTPYRPEVSYDRPPPPALQPGGPVFAPVQRLAQVLMVLLTAAVVLDLAGLLFGARRYSVLGEIARRPVPSEVLDSSDHNYGLVRGLQMLVFVAIAIVFLAWFYRVYSNLEALGARRLRHARGWAVGAWFVPFVNLIRPLHLVRDGWRASEPKAPPNQGDAWWEHPVPRFLDIWWWLFIASVLLSRLASLRGAGASIVDQIKAVVARHASSVPLINHLSGRQRAAVGIGLLADVVGLLAALSTVVVVQAVTERETRRARRLGAAV